MGRYISGDLAGEYIHYHYTNYEKYGLIVRSNSGTSTQKIDLTKALDDQRKKVYRLLNAQYNAKYYEQLENELNYITGGRATGRTNAEEIQQAILKSKLESVQNLDLADGDIDWKTMSLTSAGRTKLMNARIDLEKLKTYLRDSAGPDSPLKDPEKVDSFILSVRSLLGSQMGRTKGASSFSMANVLRHIANIQGLIANAPNAVNTAELTARLDAVETAVKAIDTHDITAFNEKRFGSGDHARNIREELAAIAKLTIVGASVAMVEGELAEALVEATANAIGKVGVEGVDEVVASLIGSATSKNVYRKSSFASYVDTDQMFNQKHFQKQGADAANGLRWEVRSFGGTKGKTDVTITLTSNGDVLESNASVKNYNLKNPSKSMQKKGLSLVTGTNLIYLLQHNARFLNHYLNQTTRATGSDADNPPQGVVLQANKAMQEMALLLAFAGGGDKADIGLSRKHAGIFIINDKSKGAGGFKIVPVVDLYLKLLEMDDSFNVSLPQNQTWNNTWVSDEAGGKGQRITNLLTEVMRHKISASVKMDKMQAALNKA